LGQGRIEVDIEHWGPGTQWLRQARDVFLSGRCIALPLAAAALRGLGRRGDFVWNGRLRCRLMQDHDLHGTDGPAIRSRRFDADPQYDQ
jgi:hypothetical protein